MFIKALCILGIKDKTGNGPIWPGSIAEVSDGDGNRMVNAGTAVEVPFVDAETAILAQEWANPNGNTPEAENAPETPKTGENGNADLEAMSFADLKAMAQEMGIKTGNIRSKAGMIDAITAAQMDSGDDFPDLTAQDVVDE